MSLDYTVTDLPPAWPGKRTAHPKASPFKTQWTRTLELLEREIKHLGGRKVEIQLDLPRGLVDLREDGRLRADARPRPPVIVAFVTSDGQQHRYPCDRFSWWQDNLYAIARALEALRLVERYGVSAELVRAGFKAIPSTTSTALTTESAADVLVTYAPAISKPMILRDRAVAVQAIRMAAHASHPDRHQGDVRAFQLVQEAKRLLEAHHGGSL